jgi:hypothetical protein
MIGNRAERVMRQRTVVNERRDYLEQKLAPRESIAARIVDLPRPA